MSKKQIISITKSACQKLTNIAQETNTQHIRFYVKGGGCNGFNYSLKPFNGKIEKGDELVNFPEFGIIVCKIDLSELSSDSND